MEKIFTNGFDSWQETHFEISSAIGKEIAKDVMSSVITDVCEKQGRGGLYELAESLTNEFESLHSLREWDGEFFDEIDKFIDEKLKL